MKLKQLMGATALVGILATFPSLASAQSTAGRAAEAPAAPEADDDADSAKEILVTGSRIARPEADGILPGVQITAEFIQARGFTNALEALNDIPLVGPGASPLNGNNGGQAASLGAAFVDLLDLGTQRTLTLVNGRRYVSGNAASLFVEGNASGSQVDVNSIPSGLIQRIDVVTVGGAAAYGADAIAGVVNFILKEDYEGLEIGALAGVTDRKDAPQYQVRALFGKNFADGRGNVVASAEYNYSAGLQADSRDFRLRRATNVINFANGSRRNTAFGPAIINATTLNNGAFLRNSDDGIPAAVFGQGFINNSISLEGTILNALATPAASNVPNANNFITLQNGVGAIETSFFNATTAQLINGVPSGNGLNGRTTAIAGLPITTFAPTALPTGVTAAQVFTQFGVTPPTGATTPELTALAVNVLQANRPTAREFFAANPNVSTNAFLGTFTPGLPRVANTDTTLVNVRGVMVPLNQVLPFVAVPLQFNADGSIRNTVAATLTPTTPGTLSQAPGSNGGFLDGIRQTVLRTQQDRFTANLNAKFDVSPNLTLFTENLYARVRNVSLVNGSSANSLSQSEENAGLVLNVNNPFLSAANVTALNAVGINAATRGGSFVVTRTNQDIFGDNPFTNTSETYRLVGGARGNWEMFGRKWSAEASATYGRAAQTTRTTQILDVEYQLALDTVRDSSGAIRCRSQLFPGQYLGRTPTGTVGNLTRQRNAAGELQEVVFTPTITQAQIDACRPLNPFGFNQMSEESKRYVRQDVVFNNIGTQRFFQGSLTGGLFDLPAGEFVISGNVEHRRETLSFTSDPLNQLGRGRAAPSANTTGSISIFEYGGEAQIPVFGPDFLPILGRLTVSPAVRLSRQTGSAQSFRNLAGNLVSPRYSGEQALIYTLGGTWAPIQDITFRGNLTRSVRQPALTELFLGGQPAFSVTTDPCGPQNITGGVRAATRRANCQTAVIAAGLATTTAGADAFLASFTPNNISLPGTFTGSTALSPEEGDTFTVGAIVQPRFIPGLTLSADYISINLSNIITPTTPTQALNLCFDSLTFPNNSPQTGANTCSFTRRGADFQIQPQFASGYINLAATQLRAINISGNYRFELPRNFGKINLRANAYHLMNYTESSAGDFTDSLESAGTFNRPQWEVQVAGRYEKGKFYSQLTWNWRDRTRIFANGQPATIENFDLLRYPSTSTFDLVAGADVNDRFRIQFNVINLGDTNTAGELGVFAGNYLDQIGRRFQVSTVVKF